MEKITSRNARPKGKVTRDTNPPQKMEIEVINNDEHYKVREVSDEWQEKEVWALHKAKVLMEAFNKAYDSMVNNAELTVTEKQAMIFLSKLGESHDKVMLNAKLLGIINVESNLVEKIQKELPGYIARLHAQVELEELPE